MSKQGILLMYVGTPDAYSLKAVVRYLRQFLSDPRVIDLVFLVRFFLVNFIILPSRVRKTVAAYRKIWLKEGSPLLVYSVRIKEALAVELGEDYQVELGMRYGDPNIETALSRFKNCDNIRVLPLFPQYSSAATGSAIAQLLKVCSKKWNIPSINIKKDFYNDPNFIEAYADIISRNIQGKKRELLLFSYHGLPKRHLDKSQCYAECRQNEICAVADRCNPYCYKAQCYATSNMLAARLNLSASQYRVSFQSRLGVTPWIEPYTDFILPKLAREGIRNIAVVCPSFVVDCLETLEEINIRAREQWKILGGQAFIFIPCLNHDPIWIKALASMLR